MTPEGSVVLAAADELGDGVLNRPRKSMDLHPVFATSKDNEHPVLLGAHASS